MFVLVKNICYKVLTVQFLSQSVTVTEKQNCSTWINIEHAQYCICLHKEDKITNKTNLFVKPLTYLSMINSQYFSKMSCFIKAKFHKMANCVDKKFPIWSDSFSQNRQKNPWHINIVYSKCFMCSHVMAYIMVKCISK